MSGGSAVGGKRMDGKGEGNRGLDGTGRPGQQRLLWLPA